LNQTKGLEEADNISSFHGNPEKTGEKVVYSYVKGPESAIYIRGTRRLTDGVSNITPPKHFSHGIETEGMTIVVTPLSAD
jgi:hypothetical protein